jgi:hypothetical protein
LRGVVRSILTDLAHRYPRLELHVVTALAEGADRLVADEALALGVPLTVALPMPRDLYEADFPTPGSKSQFARLLDKAEHAFELPLLPGLDRSAICTPGADRDQQYARVGSYLAANSQVLIALWDGIDNQHTSGTANTVRQALNGANELGAAPSPLDPPQARLVYWVPTPRRSAEVTTRPPFDPILLPSDDSLDLVDEVLGRVSSFSADAQLISSHLPAVARLRDSLIPKNEAESLHEASREGLEWFAVADFLALHFQKRLLGTLALLFVLVFAGFYSFEFYTHIDPRAPVALTAFLGFIGLAAGLFLLARLREYERKHLDYRALAEGLRVQLFWKLAGVTDLVAEHYLRLHRSELKWIPSVIGALCPRGETATLDATDQGQSAERRINLVRERWVRAQSEFFRDQAAYSELRNAGIRRVAVSFLYAAIVACVVLIVVQTGGFLEEADRHVFVAIALLLAGWGMTRAYGERRGFEAHTRRYATAQEVFARGLIALEDDGGLSEGGSLEVLRQLGREALYENGAWLLLHRDRPLELPAAG